MGWIAIVLAVEDTRLEKSDRDSLAERNHVIRRIVF